MCLYFYFSRHRKWKAQIQTTTQKFLTQRTVTLAVTANPKGVEVRVNQGLATLQVLVDTAAKHRQISKLLDIQFAFARC